ncbi:MAG: hypothetical protein IJ814_07800 [Paludibacteraceae bacterium]|nr:hypothetical protein [Paludibacteraceae bacterium]
MEKYWIELAFTLLGALLGSSGAIGLFFYLQKRKAEYNETLFIEYKNIAQELADILKDLLTLSFIPSNYTDKQLDDIAQDLSAFYYKYYLILPQAVLLEIQSLYSCLHHKGRFLFIPIMDKNEHVYVQRPLRMKNDQIKFIKDASLILRYNVKVIDRFYKKFKERKADTFLKCQARHVIVVLDREWNLKDMHKWAELRTKQTLYMQENKK